MKVFNFYERVESSPDSEEMGMALISPVLAGCRSQHQRSDGGDAGDGPDAGLLRGLPGGGRLPDQGGSRH